MTSLIFTNNILQRLRFLFSAITICSVFLYCSIASAVTGEATLKIYGTLMSNVCTSNAVDVDFGDVNLSDVIETTTRAVKNSSGTKLFNLIISCTDSQSTGIQYRFNGTAASFNSDALETNTKGLGVLISDSTSNIELGKWYTLNSGVGSYDMYASLIKDSGATFRGGDFAATSTIEVQIP